METIHVERLTTVIRCYRKGESYQQGHQPVATVILSRSAPGEVEIMAGMGQMNRRHLREIIDVAMADAPRRVIVKRKRGHGVPFGRLIGREGALDTFEIDPAALLSRS